MILSVDSILRLVIYSTVATETPSLSWSFELSETVASRQSPYLHISKFLSLEGTAQISQLQV